MAFGIGTHIQNKNLPLKFEQQCDLKTCFLRWTWKMQSIVTWMDAEKQERNSDFAVQLSHLLLLAYSLLHTIPSWS